MSQDSFRKLSRQDWVGDHLTNEQISIGCLQRIADATELMAKRHDELIRQKEAAERDRLYWIREHDRISRKLNAAKGQITKFKKQIAAAKDTP